MKCGNCKINVDAYLKEGIRRCPNCNANLVGAISEDSDTKQQLKLAAYWTFLILYLSEDCRKISSRNKLIKRVFELSGCEFSMESITRSARYIQNTCGLFKHSADKEIKKKQQEKYKEEFK